VKTEPYIIIIIIIIITRAAYLPYSAHYPSANQAMALTPLLN